MPEWCNGNTADSDSANLSSILNSGSNSRMRQYGKQIRNSKLHGDDCDICHPDTDHKAGKRKARNEAKQEIKMQLSEAENDGYDGSEYSKEEMAAIDEQYDRYCKTAMKYEDLIKLEQDPARIKTLKSMLDCLHEENK